MTRRDFVRKIKDKQMIFKKKKTEKYSPNTWKFSHLTYFTLLVFMELDILPRFWSILWTLN